MKYIFKISLLLVTAGLLAGFQSVGPAGDSIPSVSDAVHYEAQISGDTGNTDLQPSPFMPATLAEAEREGGEEIEPGSNTSLTGSSGTLSLQPGAGYLKISERNASFHPALTLLFPFHTYL